ncbi:hypothetical protein [Acinetobacter sp.]
MLWLKSAIELARDTATLESTTTLVYSSSDIPKRAASMYIPPSAEDA